MSDNRTRNVPSGYVVFCEAEFDDNFVLQGIASHNSYLIPIGPLMDDFDQGLKSTLWLLYRVKIGSGQMFMNIDLGSQPHQQVGNCVKVSPSNYQDLVNIRAFDHIYVERVHEARPAGTEDQGDDGYIMLSKGVWK